VSLKSSLRRVLHPIADPLARKWMNRNACYSGAGEDRLVVAWLERIFETDIRAARYLDIGANHPVQLSNTFLLYELGASGVLIEPDPNPFALLKAKRPRDIALNCGACFDDRRSAVLKRFKSNVFNTFSSDQADDVIRRSANWGPNRLESLVDEIEVELRPVNEILEEYFPDRIDFVSIDVEGVDHDVLRSIDLKRFRPKVVCIEASSEAIEQTMLTAGYNRIARTPDNFIFSLPTY
jgi:FkbM family methyltransferase